jgi:pyridoxamine 5'-phosphate oxidase
MEHIINPLTQLIEWIAEERHLGTTFSHGAVLGTVGPDGQPKTRMLGVHFDEHGMPRFHTAPSSRKVDDLTANPRASLTFAFQKSLRSVSIEGTVEAMLQHQVEQDWSQLTPSFRRSYLVFGHQSGAPLSPPCMLETELEQIAPLAEAHMPSSFTGYRFSSIHRIAFYSVGNGPFAEHQLFTRNAPEANWVQTQIIP